MLLMLLHGGLDTIALGLAYWAILIGVPLLLLVWIVRAIVQRIRKRTDW